MAVPDKPSDASKEEPRLGAPSLSLPKGGGAIKGIGEKLAANPVNGTGSVTVPLPVSPGRSAFAPQLSLSYDSGSGNGPFGFGWSLALPAITRKTDKGLPLYRDAEESDVFVLSGAEDLVPVLEADASRFKDDTTVPGFTIHRYRPRIESLYSRIERWTERATGEVHWRSITRENVTTFYGKSAQSRIADPADPRRVFSWLICESYDDKGDAIVYEYAAENDENVDRALANERNRVRTANRYLKRIRYGNRVSRLVEPNLAAARWHFEIVFDYGEGHYQALPFDNASPPEQQHARAIASAFPYRAWDSSARTWPARADPFSSHRSGFEVRTVRRCQRLLMFHAFDELGGAPCLVRSTAIDYADFDYAAPFTVEDELAHPGSTRIASFIRAVTQSGLVRDATRPAVTRNGVEYLTYIEKSLPPLEFDYSKARIRDEIRELDSASLENLPEGLDNSLYQWVDLDGEGVSGILSEQAQAWFYKPNLGDGRFGPQQRVAAKPSTADLGGGRQQLLDLAGDGQLDVVTLDDPLPGFHERTSDAGWEPFRPFVSRPNIAWNEPNLRFVDLDGDGHADVLITEDSAFTWHPSLAEEGFGAARRVPQPPDEERGPRLVFADGTQSIYLADMCGDGLTDLVRVRNGDVCYWPNLGYGRFGARIAMDGAPRFDSDDQFSQQRVRLADVDGSGVTDIVYLGRGEARVYFNQSGNRWSAARALPSLPHFDNLSSVTTADLLGNGTACLVWSSSLPGDSRRPVRYVDLMGGQKPHLLVRSANNLGAETRVEYVSSTKFYLADKAAAKPWITRLPFPVHVVERSETFDHVGRNRFVSRYAYHHGFFDGVEREFRGFGMVEQWDTEMLAALTNAGELPAGVNVDAASHVPPLYTRTWYHTGVYLGRGNVSNYFAGLVDGGDRGEYYREPAWLDDDVEARKRLLDDTLLPDRILRPDGTRVAYRLTFDEEREASRALKGSMLRQETYALDAAGDAAYPYGHPYTVVEQNFAVELLQPAFANRHAVFSSHPREAITYQYERNPNDPRVSHALTLDTDAFGNVLKAAAIGYPRRAADITLDARDQQEQSKLLVTLTESRFTDPVDTFDAHRTPLPCETRAYELTALAALPAGRYRYTFAEIVLAGTTATRRLLKQERTLFRRDDLAGPLPLGSMGSLGIPFEVYKLAFTPALAAVFGGRATDAMFAEGGYVHSEGDANWWIPSGLTFLSPDPAHTPAEELDYARRHFFQVRRYRDAFHTSAVSTESFVTYDRYDLLIASTRDAAGNVNTVETSDDAGNVATRLDYRVLKPWWMTEPNGNRARVAFDALGQVAGTAAMGKPGEGRGDSLDGFAADLTLAQIVGLTDAADPRSAAATLLQDATTRIVYDVGRFRRDGLPASAAALARESHASDPVPAGGVKIQIGFSYSDGFSREIQKKIQAEPGPVVEGGSMVNPRWVGSGWTIFNNKGKPVRQYKPFFSRLAVRGHRFEFGVIAGVSATLFYDPPGRVVATLHPDHTWEKVVFNAWRQGTWDANDTVALDPRTDPFLKGLVRFPDGTARIPEADYLPTWRALRTDPANAAAAAARWPDARRRNAEQDAAEKALVHAATPTVAHLDTLGRAFLTVAHNKYKYSDSPPADPPIEEFQRARVRLDIEGSTLEARDADTQGGDAQGRAVVRNDFDMLGSVFHHASMEAGERWTLNDVAGKTLRTWNSRGVALVTEYDPVRRPVRTFATGADPAQPTSTFLTERIVYGEHHPQDTTLNLRGQVWLHFDQAGVAIHVAHDFKGNVLGDSRRFERDYKSAIDWGAIDAIVPADPLAKVDPVALEAALAPRLEDETFTTRSRYDALNRPVQVIAPRSDRRGAKRNVVQLRYNEANYLDAEDVWLDYANDPAGMIDPAVDPPSPVGVGNIDYDAMGQRVRIALKNGAGTEYTYDRETYRLTHLATRRAAAPALLQELDYTFDAAGNITRIRDDAQQVAYFRNRRVEPANDYRYDALYRLIEATGREYLGLSAGAPNVPTSSDAFDAFHMRLDHRGDGDAMGTYLEQYVLDAGGNIRSVRHQGTDPADPGWTRDFSHAEPSALEPAKTNNRLSATQLQGGTAEPCSYAGSAGLHGLITAMPHLRFMRWDYRDQLQSSAAQVINGGIPEITWYAYDVGGQRTRKVTERAVTAADTAAGVVPARRKERFYMGGFEIYREFENDGTTVKLERETLHVMDDKRRIAIVETRTADTAGTDPAPRELIRYQLDNHLGSSSLELDDAADIISYEEYTPYGSTSYQAARAQTETPKRTRYMGKERDEENGFSYFGARYYAPWLCRWTAPDPKGVAGGANLYAFVRGNPVKFTDPDGKDVRLSVDPIHHTITYSTTVHVFATRREIKQLRPITEQTEALFRNPTIETEAETSARLAGGPATHHPATYTDANGTQWSVRFDVRYQFHDIARTPPPFTYDTVQASDQTRADFVSNRAANEAAMTRSFGYQPGDNVMTLVPPMGATGGETASLWEPGGGAVPSNRMFAHVERINPNYPQGWARSRVEKSITHETGHLLGFADRYRSNGFGGTVHAGFLFDLMSGDAGGEITVEPTHIEDAGRFGLAVAAGRTLVAQAVRGPYIDRTQYEQPGDAPKWVAPGVADPNYEGLQEFHRQSMWSHYPGRVEAAPEPPNTGPPPGALRDWPRGRSPPPR